MKPNWRERRRRAWRRLRGGELTPARAAWSVAAGLAIGMTPAYGFHWLLVVAICLPLRLDTGVAYLAANISMPLIAPFISFAEVEAGAFLLHGKFMPLLPRDMPHVALGTLAAELAIGTTLLAPLVGALGGATTFGLVAWQRRRVVSASTTRMDNDAVGEQPGARS